MTNDTAPNPPDETRSRGPRPLLRAAKTAVVFALVGCTGKGGYGGPTYQNDGDDGDADQSEVLGDSAGDASGAATSDVTGLPTDVTAVDVTPG